jgi:hypothetical protein
MALRIAGSSGIVRGDLLSGILYRYAATPSARQRTRLSSKPSNPSAGVPSTCTSASRPTVRQAQRAPIRGHQVSRAQQNRRGIRLPRGNTPFCPLLESKNSPMSESVGDRRTTAAAHQAPADMRPRTPTLFFDLHWLAIVGAFAPFLPLELVR